MALVDSATPAQKRELKASVSRSMGLLSDRRLELVDYDHTVERDPDHAGGCVTVRLTMVFYPNRNIP